MSSGRKLRNSRRKQRPTPESISAAWYVGYAEDGESVEAIMKKFEELERLKKEVASSRLTAEPATSAESPSIRSSSPVSPSSSTRQHLESLPVTATIAAASPDAAIETVVEPQLTQDQLEELFKRTSAFPLESVVMSMSPDEIDELEMWYLEQGCDLDDQLDEENDYQIIDDDSWDRMMGADSQAPTAPTSPTSASETKRQSQTNDQPQSKLDRNRERGIEIYEREKRAAEKEAEKQARFKEREAERSHKAHERELERERRVQEKEAKLKERERERVEREQGKEHERVRQRRDLQSDKRPSLQPKKNVQMQHKIDLQEQRKDSDIALNCASFVIAPSAQVAQGNDRESLLERYRFLHTQLQKRGVAPIITRKKAPPPDPSLPTYVRIPPVPISRAWAKHIRRIQPCKAADLTSPPEGSRVFRADVLSFDLSQLGNRFQCIYMDPPILLPDEKPVKGKITMDQFASLDIPSVIKYGFLFIWTEKELTPRVFAAAERWGFRYVENFAWIKQTVQNQIACQPSRYFNKSKTTCFIFRKEGDIELRHQRNPDCEFDFVKPWKEGDFTETKPRFIYDVIETLLPKACYGPDNTGGDLLLELWAREENVRRGWTSVIQIP